MGSTTIRILRKSFFASFVAAFGMTDETAGSDTGVRFWNLFVYVDRY